MKKVGIIVLFVMISFIVSCSTPSASPEEKVSQFLENLKHYEAEMRVTFTSGTHTTAMVLNQKYEMSGLYDMTITEPEHLKGYQMVYDGEKVEEYHPILDKKVQAQANPVKNQVLFGTFVHNYLQEETKPEMKHEEDYITITLPIDGNYKYMASEKVWFDKMSGLPCRVAIYDKEGKVTITIEIISFKYNK